MIRTAAAAAAATSMLALLTGAAPAQATPRSADCAATLTAGALLTSTVVPTSSVQLVGTSTAAADVRIDARDTDPIGAVVYHLAPGTVLDVQVAQGQELVTRTQLVTGAWVRGAHLVTDRAFERCARRLA